MRLLPRTPAMGVALAFIAATLLPGSLGAANATVDGAGEVEVFSLHSDPSSSHVIYLDFDGAVVSGTAWNASGDVTDDPLPAWSYDSDAGFSAVERAAVSEIWARVAADFAPFDVDVTTEEPGEAALERVDPDDQHYGCAWC